MVTGADNCALDMNKLLESVQKALNVFKAGHLHWCQFSYKGARNIIGSEVSPRDKKAMYFTMVGAICKYYGDVKMDQVIRKVVEDSLIDSACDSRGGAIRKLQELLELLKGVLEPVAAVAATATAAAPAFAIVAENQRLRDAIAYMRHLGLLGCTGELMASAVGKTAEEHWSGLTSVSHIYQIFMKAKVGNYKVWDVLREICKRSEHPEPWHDIVLSQGERYNVHEDLFIKMTRIVCPKNPLMSCQ